ncbi:MAG: hypothetical protein ABSB35_35880 [Bryobacteraceae bacterium]|jgi:hypothetical protein
MSWSLEEPEEPPICECKYDAARDEMDREDCPFHCDLADADVADDVLQKEANPIQRKKPDSTAAKREEDVA